ncbi:translocation/assembly module TamB domain-containing protein [Hymenobacter sediminicola]|uniref:Translocation/assembly module TamB n=1 Tax=Hymenobacter sediminicola TaxID=2761579 RepID=A0A7G7W7X6_9BACT|nr:translocation/assembly module TamB [Hymenobacter sediminicola]QNH62469.1 translocation/assembly module TamB [Hymenobacter sediminicola]
MAFVLLLVVGIVVALQFPSVQDYAARKAAGYLQDKIGTEVRIAKFRTDFKHALSLDGVYIEDQQGDTLLSVGHLGVDLDLWGLTKSEINLKSLELNDGRLAIKRTEPDSVSNYDFIVNAFAAGDTTTTTPADTTGSGFKYDIGDLRLTNIHLTYDDQVEGMNLRTKVGELAVAMDAVDVDQSIYKVDEATLRNTSISIAQTKTAPPDTAVAEPLALTFGLNRANLSNVSLTYKNDPSAQFISTRVGEAEITADNIDLINSRVALNTVKLRNTSIAYAQNENVPVEKRLVNPAEVVRDLNDAVEGATGQPANWVVTLNRSDISGVDVAFDNFNEPTQRTRVPAMDYNHLKFTDLTLNLESLRYSENSTTGRINQLAGKEKSGFQVQSAKADVVFDSVQTRLTNLDLVTPHTRIRQTLGMRYKSLDALADMKQLPNLGIEGDLRNVRLGFRDILYLAPDLAGTPPFNTGPNQSILLSGRVSGRVGDMRIQGLEFVGFRNTIVKASGRIQGLPETDRRLYTDLNIQQFTTTEADIRSLVPKGTIPNEYRISPRMTVAGTFRGRPTAMLFDADLRATTTFGNVAAKVDLGAGPKGQEPIAATFSTQNLDVGKILRDPTIGKVTANGRLNGRGGLDPNMLRGKLTANVQRATYNGYTYRGITANVDIDRNLYVVDARSTEDPNLNLDLLATVNLRDANNPSYTVDRLNLRGANLTALGFYTGGDLRVQGDLTAKLRGSDLNTINGTFSGNNIIIVRDNQPFALDSVRGSIVQVPGRTEVVFNSNIVDLNLNGNTRLGDIATALQEHIDRYFDLPDVQYRPSKADRRFTFDANVKNTAALQKLVPDLKQLTPFKLTGSFDSRAANLTMNTRIPRIVYMGYALDSLKFNVQSDPQKLDYGLGLRQISQDTTLRIPNPTLAGSIQNNQIGTRLRIAESDSAERLNMAGVLRVLNSGDAYAFSFDPKLMLDRVEWAVTPGNELRYTTATGAIFANNVEFSRNNRSLKLQTLPGAQYPLQLNMQNLELNSLARAAGMQDSLVAGTLNGQALALSLGQPRQAFTADAVLSNLVYNKTVVGDVTLKATNPTPDRYNVDVRLTNQQGTDVRAVGYYLATPPDPIRFDITVNRFDLKAAEPFSVGQLREATGGITGNMVVTGTASKPIMNGTLTTTQDAGLTLTQLGSDFRMPGQTISFDPQGMRFDNFTILDSLNNKAVVDGRILMPNLADVNTYRFNLNATTDRFLAVNSRATDNELFYGKLVLDSDTRISGNMNLPVVNTRVVVVEGSDLTIVVPNDEAGLVATDGIVEWVDKSAPLDTMLARQVALDSAKTAAGFDITARVTVNDNTPFTLVIDPISGDNLKVRAAGTLNTAIDPAGTITLTGRLDVTDGTYNMSLYDLASRKFDIGQGSSIIWSGDPYNAQLNIAAIYNVKAAPAELLASQGLADETLNAVGRNQLPFQVFLNVTGELLKPIIGFDIKLPEESRSELRGPIEARLAQLRQPSEVSELNKQVFSLLVLNRFMTDDPFKSSGGNIVADQLRGSASQVLTQQLNNLTGSYLSNLGVELGVNSYADYSSGAEKTRTDLNVAVRRQLLNNRLTVRLGTDVPLGGGNQASQGQNQAGISSFAGDVSVEYNVLANGRIRLRAFRNNAYGDIDGQFVRTGASLIFQRDYRDLADLFKGIDDVVKEEVKQNRRQQRREKKAAQDSTQTLASDQRRDTTRVAGRPTTSGR